VTFTLKQLQQEQGEWLRSNFGDVPAWQQVMATNEEAGELAHSFLKMTQGIRGTEQEHRLALMDSVGDITVCLAGVCNALGFDYQTIVERVWGEVKQRDWKANPECGVGE
jgi:NTP pyrophosphatase (non-canonical NTP hydrolase)